MRRTPIIALAAVVSVFAAVAALAAPPPVKAAPVEMNQMTKAQVEALQGVSQTPKLRLFRPAIAAAGPWHGPDLVVADPPIPGVGNPGSGQCSAYPYYPGLVYAWKIRNAGEAPTTGAASVQITCTVAPDNLPAATKTAWDQRLCGCMRKNYPGRVPALQAGKTYGDPPMPLSTLVSYISVPQVSVPGGIAPCESMYPRARVTVKVIPRPEEGPATGNNSMTMEFCN